MKHLLKLFLALVVVATAGAQVVTPQQFDVTGVDVADVDLSQAEFYFQGPLELFVTGLEYEGATFAAVLQYDGESTFTFEVPDDLQDVRRPQALDLSDIEMQATTDGVELSGLIADGRFFGGRLVPASPSSLALEHLFSGVIARESARGLMREIEALERTLAARNRAVARLNRQVEELPEQETVTELRNQTNELESDLTEATTTIESLRSELASSEEEVASLTDRLESARSELENRNDQVARLNEQIEELPEPETVRMLRTQTQSLEAELLDANAFIRDLRERSNEMAREIDALNEHVNGLLDPWITASEELGEIIITELDRGTELIGSWDLSTRVLEQTDDTQLFAKYGVPAVQPNSNIMYDLTARSTGSGWVGFGLHFLASGWDDPARYGLGRSYLVWMNRDERANQTDRSFVELYRSYDDVRMIELASAAVPADVEDPTKITVYVDRDQNEISILVNGIHVISFVDESMIATGTAVAFRSLGSAEFDQIEITTEE